MATTAEIQARLRARYAPPKVKRKSARQQVREARINTLSEARAAMMDKKRTIPKDWERGFMAAVSVLEQMK